MSFFKRLFSTKDDNSSDQPLDLSEGDIFYTYFDNQYHIYKILVNDTSFECYHVLTYKPIDRLPNISEIESLEIFVYHSPFDKKAFTDAKLLGNKPINSDNLIGYHEYLRQTQNADFYIPIANRYYKAGYSLTTDKKHFEAIDEYSKAIDLFPQFFEAIDNRAFCKMDLGLFPDAIEDFKFSLRGNPNSMLAEFYIGECYFKMGDFENAKTYFENAHKIDPNHKTPIMYLDKVNQILNG